MYCKNCGNENEDEALFCGECGAPLMPPKTPVKKKKWIWIILGVLLLAAIVSAVILAEKDKKEKMQYQTHLNNAQKYLEKFEYNKAEAEYLKAINIVPKEETYEELADLYTDWGKPEKAEEILQKQKEEIIVSEEKEKDTADGPKASEEKDKDKGDGPKASEEKDKADRPKDSKKPQNKYNWAVEPSIEADDIYYVKSYNFTDNAVNDLRCQLKSKYAVLRKKEALGLIGIDGVMNGNMDYQSVSSFVNGEIFLIRTKPRYEESVKQDWTQYYVKDDVIEPVSGIGGGYSVAYFYYDTSLEKYENAMYQGNGRTMEKAIPVQKLDSIPSDSREPWWEKTEGKYAVYSGDKLVTDFIYDECGSCEEGLLAVKKDGKWGYIDETGKEVIPIEYDASWKQYTSSFNNRTSEMEEYCYAASEGYVVLCKENKWELKDTKGKTVIPAGEFEAIRPVYKGKCWVKKDGKWGVLQIKEKKVPKDAVSFQNHFYKLYPDSMTWEEAAAICEEAGGYLVSINTEREQEFLNSICTGEKNLYWIGLERKNSGWQWIYDGPLDYANWAADEPNEDFNATEYYAQMYGKSSDTFQLGQWNDSRFDSGAMEFWQLENVGFICEWD